jgi:hypothetical protein
MKHIIFQLISFSLFLVVNNCSDTDKAETKSKPCHIDTANITWYLKDTTAAEYIVSTAEELTGFAKLVNCGNKFRDKTVKLGSNIMLNDTTNWQDWKNKPPKNEWKPIGTFGGIFDGKGYVISGVYINSSDDGQGLFRSVSGTIKNLGVAASYIKGHDDVGGLAGESWNIINNSYFIGSVVGKSCVGGLVGENGNTISDSYFIGTVTGENEVGGLAGDNSGKVINSHSIGNVTGSENAGGLVGLNVVGKIINSYSTGTVYIHYVQKVGENSIKIEEIEWED